MTVLTLIGNSKGIAGVFWIKVQGQETSAGFLTPTFAYSRFERTHTAAGEKKPKPLDLTHQNIPKFTFKEGPVFPALKKTIPLHWCRHINMKCSSCRQPCFHSAKKQQGFLTATILLEALGMHRTAARAVIQFLSYLTQRWIFNADFLSTDLHQTPWNSAMLSATCSMNNFCTRLGLHPLHIFSCHLQLSKY